MLWQVFLFEGALMTLLIALLTAATSTLSTLLAGHVWRMTGNHFHSSTIFNTTITCILPIFAGRRLILEHRHYGVAPFPSSLFLGRQVRLFELSGDVRAALKALPSSQG